MAAILSLFGKNQVSDDEPQPCAAPFSAAGGGLHYVWGGRGSKVKKNALYSYDPLTELWRVRETTGAHHPGHYSGSCVFLNGVLYTVGGYDGKSLYNTMSKLNPGSGQWSQEAGSGDVPMRKGNFHLVAVDDTTLCCFGGYGIGPKQPGSTLIEDTTYSDGRGWTNECHLFNTSEGIWSSPDSIKGDRPPPCSGSSFTKVNQHRAVLFGGWEPFANQQVSSLYEFNFRSKEITIKLVESSPGEPWPVGRSCHPACCLNYSKEHPQLLVFGGLDNGNKILRDMWILDVDNHHWTQVSLPKSAKARHFHSLTALTLATGLTEVLLFGGWLKWDEPSKIIAETTILRFECSPGFRQWTLVDVADNSTRASRQRLAEKEAKIRAATIKLSPQYKALEQQLRASQQREQATQQLLQQKTQELEAREKARREQVQGLEQRLQTTQQELDSKREELDSTREELEGKTKELAAHNTEVWRIPASRTSTIRTIGAGGWGEVMEGTVRVAMKKLHPAILTPHNLEKLRREMKLLAQVRHPNLVQFIGAVLDQTPPLIVTELLDINLRQAYERNQLGPGHRLPIYIDIARALDYLHQRYQPIIHRDVSAPNVLLERMPENQWKGKLSDLGSANFLQNAQTMGEGAIIYSPPEVIPQAHDPRAQPPKQTVKIDVYSYGVVLCEVTTSRFPSADNYHGMITQLEREKPQLFQLIVSCTKREPGERPSMAQVLTHLTALPPL